MVEHLYGEHLCLDEYKHGRVIFIGDSTHIVPIFGARSQ